MYNKMKITVVDCPIGIFALNEDLRIIDKVLHSDDPRSAAETSINLKSGKVTPEFSRLIERLRMEGYDIFILENEELAEALSNNLKLRCKVVRDTDAGKHINSNLERLAHESGFLSEELPLDDWMRRFSIELSKIKVHKAVGRRDEVVSKIIQTIDDLEKTSNLLVNRLREWYGLHFPELGSIIEKNETYTELVRDLTERGNFTEENLVKEGLPKAVAAKIALSAASSMGADLTGDDLENVRALSDLIIAVDRTKSLMESRLDSLMEEVSPNLRAVAGPLIGARLISLAGGLKNLAKMPSSTIQVLGAEKALFRSLRTGARPPKHGVIFQHRLMRKAKKRHRGKIARTLAGKLAIAARTDAFSGKFIADELEEKIQKRLSEIRRG